MSVLQFVPLQSSVDISFWSELSRRKLQDYKLSEEPIEVYGFCSCCRHSNVSTPVTFDRFSFEPTHYRPGNFKLTGELYIFNTIENFTSFDRKAVIEKTGNVVLDDIKNSMIYDDENTDSFLLQRFVLLVYANLKNHEFTYWFCFPALKPSSAYTVSMNVTLGDLKDSCITTKVETYLSDPQHFCTPFFTVKEKDDEEDELTNEVICFLDPSHLVNHPSWLLRNILMLFTYQKLNSPFKVLCCRQMSGKLDHKNSMMLEVSSLDKTHSSFAPGWETDHQGHKAPRKINLQTHFNPERLSEDAVNLNIKLMLWRAAPDLKLETLFQTRCLLIGMGTLGCAVARCLLGWGITHLTLIDSGLVSFSNPVRQSLYDFEDCLDGGKSKALAAVDHLKKIYPSANVKGYQLKVPMPGHPPLTTNDCKNVELLHQLVDDADVLFLLTDNRESRWLPTVLGSALRKVVINAALAFDSYLVMRHSQLPNSDDSTSTRLGCYFCNDVVAPGDSMSNRTLDQQCTVVRPGLAPIASALAVELMVSLLHHPSGGQAPVSDSPLGSIPHMIRGSLSNFTQLCMTTPAFHQCIACSPLVAKSYLQNPLQFVTLAVHDEQYLQNLTGLTELINQTSGALQDWEINDTESESDTA